MHKTSEFVDHLQPMDAFKFSFFRLSPTQSDTSMDELQGLSADTACTHNMMMLPLKSRSHEAATPLS
jgi:hypothetical protein